MENDSPLVNPNNGQSIFAALRGVLAELYPEENDARVVVSDAGLDAKQIAFSARAQTNWHHILLEAVRQNRLDIVLSIAFTTYPDNPRLKGAYTQYTLFTKQGGVIIPPDHLATDNPVPTVETEGGAYVARNVSAEQGDFVGRDKHISGDEVSGDKIEGDQIDARESRGFIIRPSGPVIQHYGNIFNLDLSKLPRPLTWTVLAFSFIMVTVISYIALSTGSIARVLTAPTLTPTLTVPTASRTSTPLPTVTPLAFATAAPGETLILIATFHVTTADNLEPHKKIQREIEAKIKNLQESNVSVVLAPMKLSADQRSEAEALGKQYNASMVIWGEDTRAQQVVNYLNRREPDFDASDVTLDTNAQGLTAKLATPDVYYSFIINDLPSQVSFLSLFAIGQSHYINRNYPRAITVIEEAINSLEHGAKVTGLAEAYFRLGWLYQYPTLNNLRKAIDNYNQAIVLNPDYAAAYINRGTVYHIQRKLEEAITDYEKGITLNPNYADAYYNRGLARSAQGKLEEAIADYDQAIVLNPDYADAYMGRGTDYSAQGKLEEAIADYDQAIELTPDDAKVYYARGSVHSVQGKLEEAIADYDQAIELNPDYSEAYYARGFIRYVEGKLEEAIAEYDQAIALNPNYVDAYINRGLARSAQGKLEEAIADYDQAIELTPDDAKVYYARGSVHSVQRKLEEAIADFDQAIELTPDDAKVYYARGFIRYAEGKLEEAIADFDQAIELNPDYSEAYYARGFIRYAEGKLEEAIAEYDQAIALNPNYVDAYINRGLARSAQGKLEEAIADYDQAIELNADLAKVFGERGLAYRNLDKPKEALADFRRYLELQPNAENRAQFEQWIAEAEAELARPK